MRKISVSTGIYWVECPEANLYVLCGCPADAVKHLIKRGLIKTEEKNGVTYETGPNAILLSDVSIQNEIFDNLSEFPVLQMLYRQGMILPGHPNNTGVKPILIGVEDQLKAQVEYVFLGNYGLTSFDEMVRADVSEELAHEIMRIKLRFAFDKIRKTEELIETRVVDEAPVEIRNGVFIKRKGVNLYEFYHNGQVVEVDLNIRKHQDYEPSYQLAFHDVRREYFSVLHTGEGDGWDINRPCMASILIFQGRIYLIDTGPNILHSLQALGISVDAIEGIFQTHAHDDHFNGLPVLIRSDHRIKYYATKLIRRSVTEKLAALTSLREEKFTEYFEIHDLELNKWNNVDGLEVKPVFSPHPVETTIMFFRTLWDNGYKTYAHLADITAFDVLKKMRTENPAESGISRENYARVKEIYLTPVDIKKVDIGGGLIHGNAEDFRKDTTGKVILSHTSKKLTDSQKEIGDSASFGTVDVLISADHDYTKSATFRFLQLLFPTVPVYELHLLLNCPVVTFNPGSIIIRKGEANKNIYLILSGVQEFIVSDMGIRNILTAGSMAGELSGLLGTESRGTYRAVSGVKSIRIPCNLYVQFLTRNNIFSSTKETIDLRRFLQNTWILGERISCPIKNKIALSMKTITYQHGQSLPVDDSSGLFLLEDGQIEVYSGEKTIEMLTPGDFFGEEQILFGSATFLQACATRHSRGYHVPGKVLENIPIVQWKLLETFERRVKTAGSTPVYT